MTIDFAINPMTEEFRTHSAEYFSRLLKEQPVARTELDQWLFCRHADVKRILTDHENFQRPSDWSIERKPSRQRGVSPPGRCTIWNRP
jgi:cytochrome P450